MAHPGKMLPSIARYLIATYTLTGEWVLDPMAGVATTVIEAMHLGRHGTLDVQPGLVNAAYRERHGGAVKGGGPVLRLKTYKGSFRLHS